MQDDPNAPQYLTVVGSLSAEGKLSLQPGYITRSHDVKAQGNSSNEPDQFLGVEMLDDKKGVVSRNYLPLVDFCVGASKGISVTERMVAGKVPYDPATRLLRFYHNNKLVHEVEVSKSSPEVELIWQPSKTIKGQQVVSWTGKHPEDKPLHYMVCYSNSDGQTWQPLSLSTEDTKYQIDFDQLPGGKGRVGIVATDGVNTVMVESQAFKVANKGCIAMILAPQDGATVALNDQVRFRGQGYYMEQQRPETQKLTWSSSKDGTLGQGAVLEVRKLSPGTQQITLTAGSGKNTGTSSIKIEVK
ncbi:MAG: hypothetical protein AABO41_21890 [Acidobacteriota bacterium]